MVGAKVMDVYIKSITFLTPVLEMESNVVMYVIIHVEDTAAMNNWILL